MGTSPRGVRTAVIVPWGKRSIVPEITATWGVVEAVMALRSTGDEGLSKDEFEFDDFYQLCHITVPLDPDRL